MRASDLHAELEAMIDEIEPFTPDALAVHRRVRRRRVIMRSAAAAVALVVAAGVAVSLRDGGKKRVEVTGTSKSVNLDQLADANLVVVPGSNAVRQQLEQSAAVVAYTPLPPGVRRVSDLVGGREFKGPICALRTESGFAVQVSEAASQQLTDELNADAQVFDLGKDRIDDFEVFASIDATSAQVEAIESALKGDPAVKSFRFLTHEDAFAEFRRDFGDQPDLIESTSPGDLPESFRVTLVERDQMDAAAERYQTLGGVDTVIKNDARFPTLLFTLPPAAEPGVGEIFLPIGASTANREQLAAKIAADDRLRDVRFMSHDDAYDEFKRDFADQPDLIASTSRDDLPESFRVTLVNADDATAVERDYSADTAVDAAIFSDPKEDAAALDEYCD